MADQVVTLAVNLEDGTSAPAAKASDALKQLRGTIDADTKALAQMQKAMRNLQGGASVNVEQYKALKKAIDEKKQSIATAQSSLISMGGAFNQTKPKAGGLKGMLEQLRKQTEGMPGPIGGVTSGLGRLQSMLGGGLSAGMFALAAGILAVTAAMVAGIAALTRYGVAQADARRNELLRLEGLTKLRFFYKAAAGNAKEMQDSLDEVSSSTSLGRGELAKYQESLYKMGLRGQNLTTALEGVAIKAATQGDAAANAFAGMAAGAALSGRSVKAMTDVVKQRLGGIAAKQMLSLSVQSEKLRESFDALFRDLKIEGLLSAIQEIQKLFSQSSETGKALKAVLGGIVQWGIDGFTAALPYVKNFFKGMVLGALMVGIWVLRLRNWFKQTFGNPTLFEGLDWLKIAAYAGVVVFGLLVAAIVALVAPLALFAAKIALVVTGFLFLVSWAKKAWGIIETMDWADLGRSLVDGFIMGLKAEVGLLWDAIKWMAKGIWNHFKNVLGISSPSKVFAKLGLAIPQGVEAGVEKGTPAAQASVGRMIAAPGNAGNAGAGPSPRGSAVTIGELHFHAGEGQTKTMAQDFKRELERVLEGLAISMGASVQGAAS